MLSYSITQTLSMSPMGVRPSIEESTLRSNYTPIPPPPSLPQRTIYGSNSTTNHCTKGISKMRRCLLQKSFGVMHGPFGSFPHLPIKKYDIQTFSYRLSLTVCYSAPLVYTPPMGTAHGSLILYIKINKKSKKVCYLKEIWGCSRPCGGTQRALCGPLIAHGGMYLWFK